MKKLLVLALACIVLSTAQVGAQMTIGATDAPHAGAVLDLKSTTQGLKLPAVSITDLLVFGLSGDATEAAGMVVFNSNAETGKGLYVWDGAQWVKCGPTIAVHSISVSSAGNTSLIGVGKPLQFTATVMPNSATVKDVEWSVTPGTGTGAGQITPEGLFTATAAGTVTVKATSTDGSNVVGTKVMEVREFPTKVSTFPYHDAGTAMNLWSGVLSNFWGSKCIAYEVTVDVPGTIEMTVSAPGWMSGPHYQNVSEWGVSSTTHNGSPYHVDAAGKYYVFFTAPTSDQDPFVAQAYDITIAFTAD